MHNSQARLDRSISCAGSSSLGNKASAEEVAPEAPRAATFSWRNIVFKMFKMQIAVEKLGEAPPPPGSHSDAWPADRLAGGGTCVLSHHLAMIAHGMHGVSKQRAVSDAKLFGVNHHESTMAASS